MNGIPLGTFGDASIFSFFATKMMTCGEGGMVISNSEKLINRVADLKTYDEKERYETRFKAFQSLGLKLPPDDPAHIYYRFVIGFETDSQPVVSKLVYNGIGCARPIYMPLHAYLKLTGYPLTDNAWQTSLSIPIYPSLSDQEMNRVIEVVGKE